MGPAGRNDHYFPLVYVVKSQPLFSNVNCYPLFKKFHNLTDINNYKHTNFNIENKIMIFLGILCRKLIQ